MLFLRNLKESYLVYSREQGRGRRQTTNTVE